MKKIEGCCQEIQIKEIKWLKPTNAIFKLNTDGSALRNPGKIGGGGILRDSLGDIIYAFAIPLGSGTNNLAETLAASHGIYWCLQHGYKKISLEVDSKLLTKWLTHALKPPWNSQQHINHLLSLINQLEFFQ